MAAGSGGRVSVSLGKFRGCLAGALLGDCLGAPFEGMQRVSTSKLTDEFRKWSEKEPGRKPLPYTDDTACTWALARSLLDSEGFQAVDAARKFTEEYFRDPNRGYGSNVVKVFGKLKDDDYRDVFGPAREQFEGRGSYGNGAAMRTAPLALWLHRRPRTLAEKAEECARLTHAHPVGCGGAVLQSLALSRAALFLERPDPARWVADLLCPVDSTGALDAKLKMVEELSGRANPPSTEEVVSRLGHGLSAAESVPTALYCFLRGFRPLKEWPTDNGAERTLFYAVSLGGDTDTIASMAGALAGAFYGIECLPQNLLRSCEGWEEALNLADQLHELAGE
ncbi:poly(ADP-ribose) glycohydrolase ARH3-like [Centruroides sculpturatus]|uniref:poly(ADP-ribose) glycohydrolase ARH3-like n=1 Tax=Centruroides sculpturatus TaxID=218467 RepID=UPI000C6EC977|nr:poly(ADP-ribose) glycohydrolase ARH3-like [Centruroides sculpturatus]